jgi:hypothetical protein
MEDKSIRFVIVGQGSKSGLACIARDLKHLLGHCEWQVIWLNMSLPPTSKQKYLYDERKRKIE